ncbi:translation initiation factor IF-2 [Streptomyces qinglanensis]|uniref:Translation initiation factor IF-2 n=1 Tax=Streptomyces qinglanensis TaxID=943816 RepID=A0A1E7K078_9ACTN|nr:TetR family transcriptional regulator [Streptomyces qinglanensis]OEU97319.1 translation initiation factor IF-2 [Streptomyces qinglanensis]OEV25839.1 translation initiation factor IF-2 [Streptomyces nanshensis]
MSDASAPPPDSRRPRRAPRAEERKLDPERSCRRLLDAAMDEFAAKGYAGARVQDIADRAGLNKQLIAYHFGGKEGLWNALNRRWARREETFNRPDAPLDEVMARYLHLALDDPRGPRLSAWTGLTGAEPEAEREDLSDMERRKQAGEIAAELDPGAVLLLLMGAVATPAVTPQTVRSVLGMDPASSEFREFYTEQLRRIVRRLAEGGGRDGHGNGDEHEHERRNGDERGNEHERGKGHGRAGGG